MSGIQTGIELNDNFTGIIYEIISSVNLAVSAMDAMAQGMNAGIDTSSLAGARGEINQATADLNELNDSINRRMDPSELPVRPNAPPEPVRIPVTWETDRLDVFQGTGIERFRQEVSSTDAMLEQLSATQNTIATQARSTHVLPPEAFQDLNRIATRIDHVRERIQLIENNPINMGTDTANAELAQLRAQLNRSLQAQNNLNDAVQRMDVSAANTAYINLSRSVSATEQHIRDNTDEQGRFNQRVQEGAQHSNGLMRGIKGVVGAYLTLQSLGKIIGLSDSLTQTDARLNLIVDDGGSVEELQNKIYASAQNSRGSYEATAAAVAKLGMQAGNAFSGNDEMIGFVELLNKQFVLAGTSAQGIDSVMLQLTQSMAAGKLQGEELNAVLDNASPIVQSVQKYMEDVQGIDASNIKQLAADGEITAEIIKNAMFYAAEDINRQSESMPRTWSQQWTSMKNDALMAFQPVLQRINDLANSEAVVAFVENFKTGMAVLADAIVKVFDFVSSIGSFFADNWTVIGPIVYGIAGAFAVYFGWLLLTKGALLILNGVVAIATAAIAFFNAVMNLNPVMLTVIAIILLIAVLFAVANKIAEVTGVAESGFGVICGAVNTGIQFFVNLGMAVANIALGIWNAMGACADNIGIAFKNAIRGVKSWFYSLLSTALGVIENICAALNKLPFISFDYSGISAAADLYAEKARTENANKQGYTSVGDAFDAGMSTFNAFQNGWNKDAFDAGANWGDGIANKVSNFDISSLFGKTDVPDADDPKTDTSGMGYTNVAPAAGAGGSAGMGGGPGAANNLSSIAADTDRISRSVDIANEDLKYLRDIAARSVVNRFTTAKIKVEMTNHNKIDSNLDLDGIVNNLTTSVSNAMLKTAEGVHA